MSHLVREVLTRLESEPLELDPGEREALMRALERLRAEIGTEVLSTNDAPATVELHGSGTSASSPSDDLLHGLTVHGPKDSRYRNDGEIARGGMGAIYKVFDPDLRRSLAMKIALTVAGDDARQRERLARFLEEAQVTGQLDHPGIVPVHELGLDARGRLYFTMRLVRGRHLGKIYELARAGEEGWSQTRVLGVLLKCCEAMAYAHAKGVIHRDLKPANVMVGRFGEVYVMDWGLAKVLGRADSESHGERGVSTSVRLESVRSVEQEQDPSTPLLTVDGVVLGTPAYMSPEQARGETGHMDTRSDVYAVGSMLYHLLAGSAPYVDAGRKIDARELWMRVLNAAPTPLSSLAPHAPPELVAICERAMAREIDARYPSMLDLAEDLRAYLENRVVKAYETGAWAEFRKWVRRNRPVAASAALLVLATIVGSIGFALYQQRAKLTLRLTADQFLADSLVSQADQLLRVDPALRPSIEQWLVEASGLQSREELHRRNELARAAVSRDARSLESSPEDFRVAQFERALQQLDGDKGLVHTMRAHGEWLDRIQDASIASVDAKARWSGAIRSISDRAACPDYDGLELVPQFGLLPIGRDPTSKLWEFAFLPAEDPPPLRGPSAQAAPEESTRMVLVLVPAGIGKLPPLGSGDSEDAPPQTRRAGHTELRSIAVSPFFLSKYEMSQAQWQRFTGSNPSMFQAGRIPPSRSSRFKHPGLHPVESVSAQDCEELLARIGLELPTDAQWQWAAEGIRGAQASGPPSDLPPRPDPLGIHSQVDECAANPRGIHGLEGNVGEWCRAAAPPGSSDRAYVVRGGPLGPQDPSDPTRRGLAISWSRKADTGVRPMRPIRR